ncbi:MAG: hypothetical protein II336_15635 [Loktanella sp.]|nr:hypothetical protein [Loktanella sp.]
MMLSDGWVLARGQIAWILGLLVSTGVVIQLERLELGSRLSTLDSPRLSAPDAAAQQRLDELRTNPDLLMSASLADQLAVLLALSSIGIQSTENFDELRREAGAIIENLSMIEEPDPRLEKAMSLTSDIFGL